MDKFKSRIVLKNKVEINTYGDTPIELQSIKGRGFLTINYPNGEYACIRKREIALLDVKNISNDQKALEEPCNKKPVTIDGIFFQSQAEAARWFETQLRMKNESL